MNAAQRILRSATVNEAPMPTGNNLHRIVGYDGSPPASRALDSAVALLRGRSGDIHVVYVAHLAAVDMLSADAIVEVEESFDDLERDLQAQAAEQLRGSDDRWRFERRQGIIADEMIAAAAHVTDAHPGDVTAILVGSSSHAMHRLVGSVAVSLARRSPVPIVIVP
jgi:nucleotide-binding universal stress UspA family protein